jgi:AcrR family transcriptional regulator
MTAATRRWAKTDATQQRILDAATEVFAARGFTAATMADIVDHSGASIGSIYHHFGGKRELFLAIFERLTADIDTYIDAASDKSVVLDGQLAFEANARAYLNAIWATGAPRWCWRPVTTRPASTGWAAATCSGAFTGGRRCSSSTLRRAVKC